MKARAPFAFRYQYLAGGVNTGGGWATWNADGQFVTYYIQDSLAQGITPVFTYYMIYQSLPGGAGEQSAVLANLNSTSTMQAYWADLKLFFRRAGAFPNKPVVLHVEPDMWGYVQQRATNDSGASVAAKVGSTGVPEVAGLPDTVAGLAQGIVRLRNQYAPNVVLGYHVSVWGTGVDIALSDPSDSQVDALGNRAGAFYTSLGASFDVAFGEFSDRDAAYMVMVQNKGPQSWWNSEDFRRHARFIARFVATSGKRMVMWQIPFGNTKMRAMNNTTHHYQDNRVEWLLDEPGRSHLTAYLNAGVIGFLFGGGNGEVTCACDAAGDGITNPAAINGNITLSYTADDDGGFFHNRAAAYYTIGAMSLPGGSAVPPTATPTTSPAVTPTQTAQTTATPPVPPGSFGTIATVSPSNVAPGGSATITASVTSGSAATILVDVEVYAPGGAKVHQQWFDNQAFTAGQQRSYPVTWNVPTGTSAGTYAVKIGIFSVGWGANLAWNDNAASIAVTATAVPPTPTPSATPTSAGDTAPPVITNVQATNIKRRSATISWTTDEPATHRVEYGPTPSLGQVNAPSGLATSHAVSLSGLTRNTTYYYRIVTRDAAGNTTTSEVRSFTTTR
jgi:Purple acid Phosphatase, N-terminal domain